MYKTRNFARADIGSEHDRVLVTFRARLEEARKLTQPLEHFSLTDNVLEEHDKKLSTDGRNITNLRIANYIDTLSEEEQEL